MIDNQLLTNADNQEADKGYTEQKASVDFTGPDPVALHNTVRRERRSRTPKKALRGTGGHRTTRYLDHAEFREAKNNAYAICNAGYRWSVFVSIRPPVELSDGEKQKRIQRTIAHIGQALKRRGLPYIYMRSYEKPVGGSLHGHVLIWVPREHLDVIERYADRFDLSVRKKIDTDISIQTHARLVGATPDDLSKAILYPLKEHQPAAPEYEGSGSRRRFYKKALPIRGRRIGYSTQAKAILAEYQTTLPVAVTVDPRAICPPVPRQEPPPPPW